MNLDHVFKKTNKRILGGSTRRPEVPEGLHASLHYASDVKTW